MKKFISYLFLKLEILPYIHLFREKYFPSSYYLSSLKDQKRYLYLYEKFISNGDLCFDVGAHRGHRSEIFLKLGAKVIAFEPQKELCKYLTIKYKNNIIVQNIGLGSKREQLPLFKSNISTLSTFSDTWKTMAIDRFQNVKWDNKIQIEVHTLDEMILVYGLPHFCKIDVEGFEYEVLKGLSVSIPILSFEFMLPENKDILFNCLSRLKEINPQLVVNFSTADSMILEFEKWLNYSDAIIFFQSQFSSSYTWGDVYVKMP